MLKLTLGILFPGMIRIGSHRGQWFEKCLIIQELLIPQGYRADIKCYCQYTLYQNSVFWLLLRSISKLCNFIAITISIKNRPVVYEERIITTFLKLLLLIPYLCLIIVRIAILHIAVKKNETVGVIIYLDDAVQYR